LRGGKGAGDAADDRSRDANSDAFHGGPPRGEHVAGRNCMQEAPKLECPARVKNRPYALLARFYDNLVTGVAEMNRHARGRVLGRELARARVVCDLACGSGDTAIDLARAGHVVHAVDSSPVFLRTVREKAARAGVRVRTRRADMRAFRLPEPVDLVLCEFA